MVFFADALTLDAPRRVSGGYLAVRAKAARTGVYDYAGREVDPDNAHGLRDQAVVKVLRDEATVFDSAAVRTFIGKPITDDHPKEAVTRDNWRDHGRGVIMGALRDGDHLAFDLLLMDGPTIDKVEAGKRQLSNGYAADLEFGDFEAPDGTKCQARQARITDGNHVALVDRARGGGTCRIGDAAPCDAQPQSFLDSLTTQETPVPKIMLIDGFSVDIANADTAEATIKTILAARDAANGKVSGLETQVATLTTDNAKLTTEKAALDQQLKDSKPTTAQLLDAAKSYGQVVGKAKALGVTVTDAMDEAGVMKAVVDAKMGDAAKAWNTDQIAASFAVLTKDAKVGDAAPAGLGGTPVVLGDAATEATASRDKRKAALSDAWKGPAPATAAAN